MSIDAGRYYTPTDMAREDMLPWAPKNRFAYMKVIDDDSNSRNLMRAIVRGTGTGRRVRVLGRNIEAFRKAVESGRYRIGPKKLKTSRQKTRKNKNNEKDNKKGN